jgi:hypothetical protein
MKLGHWRAGHWLGKSRADDFEVDGDDHEGSVAKTGRWFSEAWWDGHWLARTRCGEWRGKGESLEACHRGKGHGGEHAFSSPALERAKAAAVPDSALYGGGAKPHRRKQLETSRLAGDYRAYLEARHSDAEAATNGQLVTAAGRARGVGGGHWFSGRHRSTRYATEELRDWLRENGATLTASEFRAQARGAGGRRPVYDNAGVPY